MWVEAIAEMYVGTARRQLLDLAARLWAQHKAAYDAERTAAKSKLEAAREHVAALEDEQGDLERDLRNAKVALEGLEP
jgi:hypothetical protein